MRRYVVVLSPDAVLDLAAIRAFVAQAAGDRIALRLVDRALAYIDGLETAPKRGTDRGDVRPGMRTISWRRTLTLIVAVDDDAATVVVVGVVYRGRDLEATLAAWRS